jgi:4-hydroxy-tetrahydrodipicolinate synthase
MTKLLQGTYTALITPFTDNNEIDWSAMEGMVNMQIKSGVEGILFVGTTGESPTLDYSEIKQIYQQGVEMVNKRCQVILGTGTNDTSKAVELSKAAAKSGADAQLVVNPYYNKPTQRGLFEHFSAVANASDLPVILYNIKGRTGVNLETSTLLKLAQNKNIVGVKEASGEIQQMMDVIRESPKDFAVLVGDDPLTLPFMACGGDGVISVASNFIPKSLSNFIRTCFGGNYEMARKDFYRILDLMRSVFIETNPIPVKEMMALLGYCKPNFRLPICRAGENTMVELNKMVEIVRDFEKN